jgi:amidophosphoribosyltransferase
MGHIPAGEVMFFREDEEPQCFMIDKQGDAPCVFENIYFARPDSVNGNSSIYAKRIELGRKLGEEFLSKKLDVDVVSPVPDTSVPAALAIAETIKKPFREAFIKNRYSARTFIMPTHESRQRALKLKLNPIVTEVKDKKVLLVDDSIVRGTTLRRVAKLLRQKGGAKEVHLAIHCPPVINPCYYGIDMSVQEDLIAFKELHKLGISSINLSLQDQRRVEDEMANILGANSLTYLSISGLNSIFGKNKCSACFDGDYPIKLSDELMNQIRNDRIDISCACSSSFSSCS